MFDTCSIHDQSVSINVQYMIRVVRHMFNTWSEWFDWCSICVQYTFDTRLKKNLKKMHVNIERMICEEENKGEDDHWIIRRRCIEGEDGQRKCRWSMMRKRVTSEEQRHPILKSYATLGMGLCARAWRCSETISHLTFDSFWSDSYLIVCQFFFVRYL